MNRKILQKPGPQDWGTFLKAKYLPDPWPNFKSELTFVAGIPKKNACWKTNRHCIKQYFTIYFSREQTRDKPSQTHHSLFV